MVVRAGVTLVLPVLLVGALAAGNQQRESPVLFPADRTRGVNPDTHLTVTFGSPPRLGSSGRIRIYDAKAGTLVDTLDLAIPPGPSPGGAARGAAEGPPPTFQRAVIGGFTEGFHFYPVIIHDNVATIYPHHKVLTYGRTYRVEIDPGVLTVEGFAGIRERGWTFSTKARPPDASSTRLVVAADGTGDFNTVQGAVDAIPAGRTQRTTVFIRAGTYEEIVYFRRKANITFLGEGRDRVVIGYANNERFNGPPPGVPTNEKPGTFPYRRAAFMADASSGVHLVNLTIRNFTPPGGGQAEALILVGGQHIVSHVSLYSHQDTVQFNDSVYLQNSYIEGDTDFMWGRGPAYFTNCDLKENSGSPMMWVRSTAASHGFVFVRCRFEAPAGGNPGPLLARNTAAYPNSEVVLIECALGDINPAAWSLVGDTTNQRYWEYHSVRIGDGRPADVSGRHPASRQLTLERDAEIIANYSNPAYVLGGWSPSMAPVILTHPAAVSVSPGGAATFSVGVAAVPAPTYRWRRNGTPVSDGNGVSGATTATLTLADAKARDRGTYTVAVTNAAGTAISAGAALQVR